MNLEETLDRIRNGLVKANVALYKTGVPALRDEGLETLEKDLLDLEFLRKELAEHLYATPNGETA